MSSAAPPANEAAEAPPVKGGGRKKMLVIGGAALAVLLAGGGAAGYFVMQQRKAAAEADEGEVHEVQHKKKDEKKSAPVFLPLDIFTVNLADREAERYAQVGVTLELADTKTSDQLKTYMPAIRNDILMLLAHKRADELQERDGKLTLAREIRRAAMKPLLAVEDKDGDGKDEADEEPVRAVHFSAFIIQ